MFFDQVFKKFCITTAADALIEQASGDDASMEQPA